MNPFLQLHHPNMTSLNTLTDHITKEKFLLTDKQNLGLASSPVQTFQLTKENGFTTFNTAKVN